MKTSTTGEVAPANEREREDEAARQRAEPQVLRWISEVGWR